MMHEIVARIQVFPTEDPFEIPERCIALVDVRHSPDVAVSGGMLTLYAHLPSLSWPESESPDWMASAGALIEAGLRFGTAADFVVIAGDASVACAFAYFMRTLGHTVDNVLAMGRSANLSEAMLKSAEPQLRMYESYLRGSWLPNLKHLRPANRVEPPKTMVPQVPLTVADMAIKQTPVMPSLPSLPAVAPAEPSFPGLFAAVVSPPHQEKDS